MELLITLLVIGVLCVRLLTRWQGRALIANNRYTRLLTAVVLTGTIIFCVAAWITTPQAKADTAPSKAGLSPNVDQATGTFTSDVKLQVPAFHGLEPELKLHYSSTQNNDWLGVGWELLGTSSIQRASVGGGAPAFTNADVYYLDGQELVADTSLGGNYSTKFQTYQRIQWDSAHNSWTVWQKNGVKMTYVQDFVVWNNTLRWSVSSVSDTLGNTVTYTYWCDGKNYCYPQKISYNGTVITFYLESRPDPVLRASGLGMTTMAYRLKTLDITTSDGPVRSYVLKYIKSSTTGRSILKSVQQYGRDRVISSDGTITSGSNLPAISFAVSGTTGDGATANKLSLQGQSKNKPVLSQTKFAPNNLLSSKTKRLTAKENLSPQTVQASAPWLWIQNPSDREWLTGDFNGDALTDIAYLWRKSDGNGAISIAFANGNGTFTSGPDSSNVFTNGVMGWTENTNDVNWIVGDFNGDGKDDISFSSNVGGAVTIYTVFSSGDGHFTLASYRPLYGDNSAWAWLNRSDSTWLAGDFNGDGKSDIAYIWNKSGHVLIATLLSRGDGTYDAWTSDTPQWGWVSANIDRRWMVGDFNGDGKSDIAYLWNKNGTAAIYTAISASSGTTAAYNAATFVPAPSWGWDSHSVWLTGDFNGDSKTDFAYLWNNNGTVNIYQAFSRGDGGFDLHGYLASPWLWDGVLANSNWQIADVNGDGKTDIIYLHNHNGIAWSGVGMSQGNGVFTFADYDQAGGTVGWLSVVNDRAWLAGDVNGDQRSDALLAWNSNGAVALYAEASNGDGTYRLVGTSPTFNTANTASANAQAQSKTAENGKSKGPASTPTKGPQIQNSRTSVSTTSAGFHGASAKSAKAAQAVTPFQVNSNDALVGSSAMPDLIIQVNNGLGGTTNIRYQPLSFWPNSHVPVGFSGATVSAITTGDGRGNSSTTNYSYSGAGWDWTNHRLQGFQQSKATIDSQGNTLTTNFHQSAGSLPGKAESTILADPDGKIYEKDIYTYIENTAAPYVSQLSQTQVLQYELSSSPRTIQTRYNYDSYGNTTTLIEDGDTAVSGDERTTETSYAYNTGAYLVASPAKVTLYAGIGTAGALLSQTRNLYDGASAETTPPTKGLLTATQAWNDQSKSYLTTSYVYDSYGNSTQTTDPLNRVSKTSYDETYHLYALTQTNALNQTTSQTWDVQLGLLLSTTDLNNNMLRTTYDALGRPIQTSAPDGTWTTKTQYLYWGDLGLQHVRVIKNDGSADGLWKDTYFDGLSRIWRTMRRGVDANHTLYQDTNYVDATQNAAKQSLWYVAGATPIWTNISYDGQGRVTSTTYPDGAQQRISYGVGMQKVFDPLNDEKDTYTDGLGHMSKVVEVNGSNTYTTTFTYNLRDQLTQRTDALGSATKYQWDSLGNKIQTIDADLGTWSYSYDAANQLTSRTDAKGQTVTSQYDALGRLVSTIYPDQSRTTRSYDPAGVPNGIGRLGATSYPNGNTQIQGYDYAGNVTQQTWTVGTTSKTLKTAYDKYLRLTSITYPDNEQVIYGYDPSGNLLSVSGYVESMTYDAAGHLTGQVNTNGTTEAFTYDPNREWLTSASVKSGSTELYQASYTSDKAGRISRVSSSTDTQLNLNYSYDPLSRLTGVDGAQTASFAYDAAGNIITSSQVGSYTYADPAHKHAVTSAGTKTYTYDANGNQTSGAGRTLTWNYDNQLASVTQDGATTSYTYDDSEQRISKTHGDQSTLYFGALLQQDTAGLTKYIYASSRLVAEVIPAGAKYWYHADHLGSTRLMTDRSGAAVQHYAYSAFGQTISKSGDVSNTKGFGGHYSDEESGLLYMNARYYDPLLSRFLSADTASQDGQNPQKFNRYSYADNNPVSNVDPTGHDSESYSGGSSSFGSSSGFSAFSSSSGGSSSYSFDSSSSFGATSLSSAALSSSLSSSIFGSSLFSLSSASSGPALFGGGVGSSSLSSFLSAPSFSFSSSFSAPASLLGSTNSSWFSSNSFALSPAVDLAVHAYGSTNSFSLQPASSSALGLGTFPGLGWNPAWQQDSNGIAASSQAGSSSSSLQSIKASAPDSSSISQALDLQDKLNADSTQWASTKAPTASSRVELTLTVNQKNITIGDYEEPFMMRRYDTSLALTSSDGNKLARTVQWILLGTTGAHAGNVGGDAIKKGWGEWGSKSTNFSSLWKVALAALFAVGGLIYVNDARVTVVTHNTYVDFFTNKPSYPNSTNRTVIRP